MQATGRMPRDLGGLGDLMVIRSIAAAMVTAVRDLRAGRATPEKVEEIFKRAAGIDGPREAGGVKAITASREPAL